MVSHRIAGTTMRLFFVLIGTYAIATPWGTIYYRRKEDCYNERLRRHELCHIAQYKREGSIKFLVKYLWFNIRYGYNKNPYEIEAEIAEKGKTWKSTKKF